MSVRDFTVVRRRPGIVDLITPKQIGIQKYVLQASPNFDGVFTQIVSADISSGYLDPSINPVILQAINNVDHVRIVFNPSTFTVAAGISDTTQFWLKLKTVDYAGADVATGDPSLILPDDTIKSSGRILIQGNAPNGAGIANSLRLHLPQRMRDFHIRNNAAAGGTVLFVAAVSGGAERQVAGQETVNWFDGAQGAILVRGGGGIVSFTADFTQYAPI